MVAWIQASATLYVSTVTKRRVIMSFVEPPFIENCGRSSRCGFGRLRIGTEEYFVRMRVREAKKHIVYLDIDGPAAKRSFNDALKGVSWWRNVARATFVCDSIYRYTHLLGDIVFVHTTLEFRNGACVTPDPHPPLPEPVRAPVASLRML